MTVEHSSTSLPATGCRSIPTPFAMAVVAIAVVVAFWPVFGAGFAYWDDTETIQFNPAFDPPTWSSLLSRWTGQHLHIYIPLTHTIWHVIALFSQVEEGARSGGYVHAMPFKIASVTAHLVTSLLVLLILRRLAGAGLASLLGALLFALHPLQVESVGWTSGLKDVLFGLFGCLCLLLYLVSRDAAGRLTSRGFVLSLAALIFAGLGKPTAMVLPVMLIAVDRLHFRRPWGEVAARLTPFFLVGAAFAIYARTIQPPMEAIGTQPLWARPLIVVDSLAFYLRKLFLPTGLAYDYGRSPDWVMSQIRSAPWAWAIALALVIACAAALFAARRRVPIVPIAAVWCLMPLMPVLGWVKFDFAYFSVVSDHYMYLPMAGVALLAAGAIAAVPARRLPQAAVGVAAVLVIFGALTFRQAGTWHDVRSISRQTLSVNPRSFGSWGNLASMDLVDGDVESAARHGRKAMELQPDDSATRFLMSHIVEAQHDLEGAIRFTREAQSRSPFNPRYAVRLGDLLVVSGQYDEALQSYEYALKLDRHLRRAIGMRAQLRALLRQGTATAPATTQAATNPAGTSGD